VSQAPDDGPIAPQPQLLLQRLEQRFRALTFAKAMVPTMCALGLQFLAFVVTARGLGAELFGVYTSMLAVALIASDVVGLGSVETLTMATARNRLVFRRYFGHVLLMTSLTLPVFAGLAYLVARHVMHMEVPMQLLASVIVAEILIGRSMSYLEAIKVCHGDAVSAAWTRFTGALIRTAGAAGFFLGLGRSDLQGWVTAVALVSAVTTVWCYLECVRRYGRPVRYLARHELQPGLVFCGTQIAATLQANVDRVGLTRYASASAVGAYGAAMRILQLGMFPLQIATRITFPRFFSPENAGPVHGLRFASRVAKAMAVLGLASAGLVVVASYLVPLVLGRDFSTAQPLLMVLSMALPLIAIQTPAADTLIAMNRQGVRAFAYWFCALTFAIAAVTAARWGGGMAIAASFVAVHLLLAVGLWAGLLIVARPARRLGPNDAESAP
jgi:O-antigen/teichoic acid export membrane protein